MNIIDKFLKDTTEPREIEFWGKKHKITPALVSDIHGDGKQIVGFEPQDTRPNFYVLCIDSAIDIEAYDFEWDEMLLRPVEEEFGNIDDYEEVEINGRMMYRSYSDKTDILTDTETNFPTVHWNGGRWWTIANFGKNKTNKVL